MTRIALLLRLTCAVLLLFAAASYVSAQDMSAAQKEVWQMEETYWKDVKDSNADHYASLWHPSFLGWPQDRDRPVGKTELTDGVRKKMAEVHVASYEFLSKGVTVLGNVGVTVYSVRATRAPKDGKSETHTSRITHTWLKTGSTWEIIGGMSGPYESIGHTW
jgi:ketosteroid isomerase-like protein